MYNSNNSMGVYHKPTDGGGGCFCGTPACVPQAYKSPDGGQPNAHSLVYLCALGKRSTIILHSTDTKPTINRVYGSS